VYFNTALLRASAELNGFADESHAIHAIVATLGYVMSPGRQAVLLVPPQPPAR